MQIYFFIFVVALLFVSVGLSARSYKKKYGSIIPSLPNGILIAKTTERRQIVFSFLATSLGGAITIAFIGLIYNSGTVFYAAGIAFFVGLLIYKSLIKKIRKSSPDIQKSSADILTFEDFLSGSNKKARFFISLINLFAFTGLVIAQIISMKLLFDLYMGEYAETAMWLVAGALALYLFYGFHGVLNNEKIQLFVIFFWLIGISVFCFSNLDLISEFQSLPKDYLYGFGLGPVFLIAVVLLLPWTTLARADLWQRINALESDEDAEKVINILMYVMLAAYTLLALAGLILKVKFPQLENGDGAAFEILGSLPPALLVFALLGIFSALLSSADSFLQLCSVAFFKMLPGSLQKNTASYILVSLLVTTLAFYLSLNSFPLGSWVIMASTIFAVLLPPFFFKLFYNGTPTGALYSSIAAVVVISICLFLVEFNPNLVFIPATLAAILGQAFGEYIAKKRKG